MSLPSQLPTAIDRLVALSETALPDAKVVDGIEVSSDYAGEWVAIGSDGSVGEEEEAARSRQTWEGLGAKARREELTIVCSLGTSTGDTETSMKPRRDRAYQMLALIEAALRTDPGLANFVTGGGAAITDSALRYAANSSGMAAVITFTVEMPVRI